MYGIKSAIMGKTVQSVGLLLTLTKDGVKVEPQNICVPTVFICSRTLMEVWKVRKLYPTPQSPSGGYDWSRTTSVQFSRSVVSDSLRPHGLQHARPPCPSPTPRVYPNSCTLSRWCHPTISSSVIPFSSCPQSLPASGSFPMSQLFALGGQSIRVSASASVLPMNIQDWSPLGWTGWISLQSKGLKSLLQHPSSKASILQHSAFFIVQLSDPYMTTGKTIALTRWTFVSNVSAFEYAI